MSRSTWHLQELRERAVPMVFEHRWEYGSQFEALASLAEKIRRVSQ